MYFDIDTCFSMKEFIVVDLYIQNQKNEIEDEQL